MKRENNLDGKTVVISRTDSIGDVILTLPLCAWIKQIYPTSKLIFLGKKYTNPVLTCFDAIDEIKHWDELENLQDHQIIDEFKSWQVDVFLHVFPNKRIAKLVRKAHIPLRVGTSHRAYHLLHCNIRPNFTRKNSDYHESQLNFNLLRSFGVKEIPSLSCIEQWVSSFRPKRALSEHFMDYLQTSRKKVILHPKSQGSAVEWPIEKYLELAQQLIANGYRVFFSGTEKEGMMFREKLPIDKEIIDISGRMSLGEFISFISHCDALVACSTGPLHIASILGIEAVGIYTNVRPMHPGRWKPIGATTEVITGEMSYNSPEEEIKSIAVERLSNLFIK